MYFEVADITASIPLLILWGAVVGLVFSTVGAAGGILSSFGLITIFAIQDPNLVKPMAQSLTLVTPLIAVPLYIRQCRVMYLLAALLGMLNSCAAGLTVVNIDNGFGAGYAAAVINRV